MDLTTASGARPLTVWAVSDGRAGIEAQALALAEAVARARPAAIEVKRVVWPDPLGRLPTAVQMLLPPPAANPAPRQPPPPAFGWSPSPATQGRREPPPHPPPAPFTGRGDRGEAGVGGAGAGASQGRRGAGWPDLWIAAGRASLPLSVRARRHSFVVQAQDPRWPVAAFDLVVPPAHDGLAGDNVFPILGAPSRMTPARLAEGRAAIAARLSALPRPHVAAAIGGASAAYDLPAGHAAALARAIRQAVGAAGGSLLLTFSRRTPPAAAAAMRPELEGLPGWIWDGTGDNPYAGFLGGADHVLVTEDSVNMALDAAAGGAPVHILPLKPRSPRATRKFRAFHAALADRGASRPFAGGLASWTYAPILEADRAAAEILRRLDARRALDPRAAAGQPAA